MFSELDRMIAGTSAERPCVRKVRAPQGKGAGQFPVKVTLRKVQQKRKPPFPSGFGKDEKAR